MFINKAMSNRLINMHKNKETHKYILQCHNLWVSRWQYDARVTGNLFLSHSWWERSQWDWTSVSTELEIGPQEAA